MSVFAFARGSVDKSWFQHFRIETAKRLLRPEPNTERESHAYGIRDELYGASSSMSVLSVCRPVGPV